MSVNESVHYNTIFDTSTCVKKGFCRISKSDNPDTIGESHDLYFEQHGSGPEKILFIMGYSNIFLIYSDYLYPDFYICFFLIISMNNPSVFWENQVRHFSRLEAYSVLVFDNRGVGHSTFPKGPFR